MRGRAEDRALQRRFAVAADDDHARVAFVGDREQCLGCFFRDQLRLDLGPARGRALSRRRRPPSRRSSSIASSCSAISPPQTPGRRVAEDDDDLVAEAAGEVERHVERARRRRRSRRIRRRSRPSVGHSGRAGCRGFALEEPGRDDLRLTAEEFRHRAPLDEHQDDPEEEEEDRDQQRRPDSEPGVAGFGVRRVGEFDRVLDQQVEEDRAAEAGPDADEEEVLDAAGQLAPVVDRCRRSR